MRIRVLRLLEYIGSAEFVETSLSNRAVKGQHKVGGGMIREAFIGEFPETLDSTNDAYALLLSRIDVEDRYEVSKNDKE